MTNKNWFRYSVLLLLLFAGISYAKRAPSPSISITEVFENQLVGEINTHVGYSLDYRRIFFLVNSQGQIAWQGEDKNPKEVISSFSFQMPEFLSGGLYDLQVVWMDKYRQKMATAAAVVENSRGEENNVFVVHFKKDTEQDLISVSSEWESSKDVQAQLAVQIRENSYWGSLVLEKKTEISSLEKGEPFASELSFDLPQEPESYMLLAQLVDLAGKPLTPMHQERLIVPGDFAEIFSTLPASGTDIGAVSNFKISGKGLAPLGEGYKLRFRDESGAFNKSVPLENVDGSFSFKLDVSVVPSESPQYVLYAEVLDPSGKVLDQKKYEYKKTAIVQTVEISEPEFKIPFWAYLVGGFGLLILIGGLFCTTKKR